MDDIVKLIGIMVIIIGVLLMIYCKKSVCSEETKQYYVYTVILGVYVVNFYYIITQYKQYDSDTWKVAGLLIAGPVIMYMCMCQQNCFELFLPTFFVIFPCIMIIFNFYMHFSKKN
jgi:hypothetical protein